MLNKTNFNKKVPKYINPNWSAILLTEESSLKFMQISIEKPKWNKYTFLREKGNKTWFSSKKWLCKEKETKKSVKNIKLYKKIVLIINSIRLFY